MAGYHLKSRIDVELDTPDVAAAWKLPEPGQLRMHGPLLQLEAVSFTYPDPKEPALAAATAGNAARPPPARKKPVLSNITLCIEQVCSAPFNSSIVSAPRLVSCALYYCANQITIDRKAENPGLENCYVQ